MLKVDDAPMKDTPSGPRIVSVRFPRGAMEREAVDAVVRLQKAGHTAYMVGGGVRDLLLGRTPKDFDISTSADLKTVRGLFRSARVIGRRFPIVHLRFGPHVYEVSTFRKRVPPENGDAHEPLAPQQDHGTPADDARARDFTVNALFYDPARHQVIDHVGGLDDLQAGVLRSVGAPRIWFLEDPVRILRAAKFAGRLGFEIPEEERTWMRNHASLLHVCPPSRVTEELFRILESGSAAPAFLALGDTGVLQELMPEVTDTIGGEGVSAGEYWTFMRSLDRLVRAHGTIPRDFLFAASLYPVVRRRFAHLVDDGDPQAASAWGRAVDEWLHDRSLVLQIPRSYRMRQRTLLNLLGRLLNGGRPRRPGRLVQQEVFPHLMTLLRLHARVYGGGEDLYLYLRRRGAEARADIVPRLRPPPRRGRRNGNGSGRRGRGDRRNGAKDDNGRG